MFYDYLAPIAETFLPDRIRHMSSLSEVPEEREQMSAITRDLLADTSGLMRPL